MVLKGIIDMDERLSFSASPIVYEDGWVPAKPQRESSEFVKAFEFNPVQTVNKNGRIVPADKTNRSLCFEYMQNGNLREYLSDEELEAPICHFDLKPANVLLDGNMVPKLADFGQSRRFGGEQTRITRSSIGTQGYLAPEYIDKAPTAEDSVDLVLDSDGSALTPAPCMHQHLLQGNLPDERSDKPRCNRAPATSSSDVITRASKAHKLTDDEAENHSIHMDHEGSATRHDLSLQHQYSRQLFLGSGGFAVVYKGCIGGNRTVAVKKPHNPLKETEFNREIECLMKVKHKNVVRFLGYCSDTHGQVEKFENKHVMAEEQERLLCFEYLPGRLDKYTRGASCELEWRKCYQIINGICGGIHWLHNLNKEAILRLDLKPANILLDEDMVPKIADFGISRCLGGKKSEVQTQNIGGTLGYISPEFADGSTRVLTKKFDLYSLGVIILEILTGRKERRAIDEVIDSCIGWLGGSPTSALLDQMKVCAQIAIECCDENPDNRPSDTKHIIDRLEKVASTQVIDSCIGWLGGSPTNAHLLQSNLTDERSDKPRSNRAPATSASDVTTRAPKAHKLTDDEAENHSDPNSRVAERDSIVDAKRSGEWYVATGAAHHATGDRGLMTNMLEFGDNGLFVHAADGTPMPVGGCGSVVTDNVVLGDVYYVPGLWANLVSVGQLAGLDYCVGFGRGACVVSDAGGTVVGRAHARGDGLYEVDYLRVPLDMP